jgi:hypothetical protein
VSSHVAVKPRLGPAAEPEEGEAARPQNRAASEGRGPARGPVNNPASTRYYRRLRRVFLRTPAIAAQRPPGALEPVKRTYPIQPG